MHLSITQPQHRFPLIYVTAILPSISLTPDFPFDVIMGSFQTRTEKSYLYSTSYSNTNLKSPSRNEPNVNPQHSIDLLVLLEAHPVRLRRKTHFQNLTSTLKNLRNISINFILCLKVSHKDILTFSSAILKFFVLQTNTKELWVIATFSDF